LRIPTSCLLLLSAALGCSGQKSEEPDIGGGHVICDSSTRAAGGSDGSVAVVTARDVLVPQGSEIHCTDSQRFEIEGQAVHFVLVAYGALSDCPAGCFSSNLCAIVDHDGAQLYSAVWYAADEKPRSIPPDCPELGQSASAATVRDCQTPPDGYDHPLTQAPAFQSFRQVQSMGDWRFCF
jgi:hypothetical protein